MKSSGLRPDGSQTRASDVSVSTPRWTSGPLKKVPLKDARTCLFVFLLVVDTFYYTTPHPEVLHLDRNPVRNWRVFGFFFSLLFWHTSHDRFGFLHFPLCHSTETKSGRLQMHTPSTAFSIDTQIPRAQHRCNILLPPLDVKISQLIYRTEFAVLHFTEYFKWRLSPFFLAHYALPRTPCSSVFKRRRAASWCLFELCAKYRYRKSPRGQTHKALTVSYWVLVPITHLHGLFSCQLPRRNSQLFHDFRRRVWAEQVLTDSPNSHSNSVCQQNTWDLQCGWRRWLNK